MKFNVKINHINTDNSPIKAYASVNFDGIFAVTGIKVMKGSKGYFVSMPSYKSGNGEYRDVCFPTTQDFRKVLYESILNCYNQALSEMTARAAESAHTIDYRESGNVQNGEISMN